ncbi:MAG: hypothetical protein KAR62_02525, partial [Sphingomonadales bacterium]|nr:hypothetical protein [Sphingomonadales bacterium]
ALLGEAFGIFKKMFTVMILLYLVYFLVTSLVAIMLGADTPEPTPLALTLNIIIAYLLTAFLSGVYTASVWSHMNQHESPIKQGMARCLEVFPMLLGSMILVGIFAAIGLLLFIVPGIIVALALSLVAPVVVIENPGITASLKRSYELTDGYKVKIFYILMIMVAVVLVPIAIASLVFGPSSLDALVPLLSGIITVFNAILYVVIYKHLSAE